MRWMGWWWLLLLSSAVAWSQALLWDAPAGPVVGYRVYVAADSIQHWTQPNVASISLGPTPHAHFRVTALYDEGESGWSNAVAYALDGPCAADTVVVVERDTVEVTVYDTVEAAVPETIWVVQTAVERGPGQLGADLYWIHQVCQRTLVHYSDEAARHELRRVRGLLNLRGY
jgi:hypothetical protein